jgi:hypothetical protein
LPSVVRTHENCCPVASAVVTTGVLGNEGATESLPHAGAPASTVAAIDGIARRMVFAKTWD